MCRGTRNFADFAPVRRRRLMMVLVMCLMLMDSVGIAIGAAARQQSFASPEAGVQALIEAAKSERHKSDAADPWTGSAILHQHGRPGFRSRRSGAFRAGL